MSHSPFRAYRGAYSRRPLSCLPAAVRSLAVGARASSREVALIAACLLGSCRPATPAESEPPDSAATLQGAASIELRGPLMQWHGLSLELSGPGASEADSEPNPFTDYRFEVQFQHESGLPDYRVPGYFAADGRAGDTGADAGRVWRAHLSPDKTGTWSYRVSFVGGPEVAISGQSGAPVAPYDGMQGEFEVLPSDKLGRDFRSQGRLEYVGGHHLRFAGTSGYFLKAGPDSPETLLAYVDFDGGPTQAPKVPLKTWAAHAQDFREGDPTWRGGRGKGLIGALNYLAGAGANSISFLPYNAGGDGDNVWPFARRDDKLHYDASKLDQWEVVFSHAQQQGLFLHFKLQETENDDQRKGKKREAFTMDQALDGGSLGPERKLYLREIIARFGHHLALNWNLGEENTQTTDEQRAMAQYIADTDPYGHLIVLHTYPDDQDKVYTPMLGDQSALSGASLQNAWDHTHRRTWQWLQASEQAGRPWVVANDEQGPAKLGVPPDPGFAGFEGTAGTGAAAYDLHDVRRYTLWGNLMAGGAGVEYYFGYDLPQNDLVAEDFRSRSESFRYCRVALDFFHDHRIPFWKMTNVDELVGNPDRSNELYAFAQDQELYLVYLPHGGKARLDLTKAPGRYGLRWFNPRTGGPLQEPGQGARVNGGTHVALQAPSEKDWLAVVRRE